MKYRLNWEAAVGYWKTVGYELVGLHSCSDRTYSAISLLKRVGALCTNRWLADSPSI